MKSKTINGYTIAPLSAREFLESIPELGIAITEIAKELLPNDSYADTIGFLNMGVSGMLNYIIRCSQSALFPLIAWTAKASKIPEDIIIDDPKIGITGFMEIFLVVLEVNRIPDFFATALPAVQSVWQGIKSGAVGSAMESTKA